MINLGTRWSIQLYVNRFYLGGKNPLPSGEDAVFTKEEL
jgi:hypothetical protein